KAFFVFTFTLGTKHSGFPYFVSLIKTTGSSQRKNDLSDDSIKFTIFFALSVRITVDVSNDSFPFSCFFFSIVPLILRSFIALVKASLEGCQKISLLSFSWNLPQI